MGRQFTREECSRGGKRTKELHPELKPPAAGLRGSANPRWKKGKILHRKEGLAYWLILNPEHHRANTPGYVKQSNLVAEEKLGRPLTAAECVHHINFDSMDDRPENIAVMPSQSAHRRAEATVQRLVKPLIEKGIIAFDGERYTLKI